eukprot:CAMPEP_0177615742 /NCGR_PEP_ID=MMETSP0419_2-20121207/23667_1 /TAXON_ID=582737 /ORGANISM="Tetraselmis sp., Strain GSL018" /LENGTH=40 /DNA_ID= /DNA_START= /DNA_END= /DNA_ORIENTATION=
MSPGSAHMPPYEVSLTHKLTISSVGGKVSPVTLVDVLHTP